MKWWKLLLIALFLTPAAGMVIGCEVDADADDDNAKLEIEAD